MKKIYWTFHIKNAFFKILVKFFRTWNHIKLNINRCGKLCVNEWDKIWKQKIWWKWYLKNINYHNNRLLGYINSFILLQFKFNCSMDKINCSWYRCSDACYDVSILNNSRTPNDLQFGWFWDNETSSQLSISRLIVQTFSCLYSKIQKFKIILRNLILIINLKLRIAWIWRQSPQKNPSRQKNISSSSK